MGGCDLLWNRHLRLGQMRGRLYCGSNDVLRQRRADLRRLRDVGLPSRMHQSGLREWRLHRRVLSKRREVFNDEQRCADLRFDGHLGNRTGMHEPSVCQWRLYG